ncbi:MAG: hypothetical protein ACR2NP_15820 [Pirellulaceae bacterium]
MIKEIELETTRYVQEVRKRDAQWNRLLRRQAARERLMLWSLFAAGCGLSLIGLALGWFDNIDVAGGFERFRAFWRS